MNKLTKLSVALIATLALTTGAAAQTEIGVTASQADIMGESATSYGVNWGYSNAGKQGFYWATQFSLESIQAEAESVIGYGGDLKLGYSVIDNLAIYAIGSGIGQDIAGGQGAGFGFGGGASYQVFKNMAVQAEYKTYSMTHESGGEYDYDTMGVNLKWTF